MRETSHGVEGSVAIRRARVWWPDAIKPLGIGSDDEPFDLAVATVGESTRVAISYATHVSPTSVDVWSVHDGGAGKRTIKRDYPISDVSSAKVAMTGDGKYLVTRDPQKARIYELSSERPILLRSLDFALRREAELCSRSDCFVGRTTRRVSVVEWQRRKARGRHSHPAGKHRSRLARLRR